jgi:myo-inositol 2-dehydrogenase/D-chiro-inositol 1-dehydrogenase
MQELRVGIIGCGAIGRAHIQRINRKIQGAGICAVSDINRTAGQQVADSCKATFYENGNELIASSDIDAVIITSLDETHEKFVLECIKAGKYVFCEKPLSPDVDGCQRIVEAEMKSGKRVVQVGFMRRYDPGYQALKEVVESRKYGEPLMVHCAHRNGSLVEGFTTPMLISNCLSHELDILRWLFNEYYVSCQVIMPKKTRRSPDFLHDPQILLLETETGIAIDVEVFVNCQYGYDIQCEIVSEDATFSLPVPESLLLLNNGSRSTHVPDSFQERFSAAYDLELQEWVDASLSGCAKGPSSWDGYLCTFAASICGRARESGERLKIACPDLPDFYK